MEIIKWLSNNANWVFDGIGVTIVIALFGSVFNRFRKPQNQSAIPSTPISFRSFTVGDNSFNFQGDNVTISNSTLSTSPKHREADLSLVDVTTYENEKDILLDIKIRNVSDEVVFLKRAEFKTINRWDIDRPGACFNAVLSSYNYDVIISSIVGETVKHNISQSVKPNDVDRFTFTTGTKETGGRLLGLCLYLVELKLIYNEDNRLLILPRILVEKPSTILVMGAAVGPAPIEQLERNRMIARDLLSNIDDKVIIDPQIAEAVHSWAEADFSNYRSESMS